MVSLRKRLRGFDGDDIEGRLEQEDDGKSKFKYHSRSRVYLAAIVLVFTVLGLMATRRERPAQPLRTPSTSSQKVVPIPSGARNMQQLPQPLRTPATSSRKVAPVPSGARNMQRPAQPLRTPATSSRKVARVPSGAQHTFYLPEKEEAVFEVVVKEHQARGHRRVKTFEEAHFVWRKNENPTLYDKLKPWQRHNFIPNRKYWDFKAYFVEGMDRYSKKTGRDFPYLPRSFRLYDNEDKEAFLKLLKEDKGKKKGFVLKRSEINQGKGITMLAPNSKELDEVEQALSRNDKWYIKRKRFIVQEYLCNGLLFHGRKFDLRAYWAVVSIDPLVVLFRTGFMRVARAAYNETDIGDKRAHITNGSQGSIMTSWDELPQLIRDHHGANKEQFQRLNGVDPVAHVHNQMKAIMSEVTEAFRTKSFGLGELTSENGFSNLAADFYIDNDLDVYLIEPQSTPNQDFSEDCRGPVNRKFISDIIDIVGEVHKKQSRGAPILPIEDMGEFDLIYAPDYQFTYNYQRPKEKKGCQF